MLDATNAVSAVTGNCRICGKGNCNFHKLPDMHITLRAQRNTSYGKIFYYPGCCLSKLLCDIAGNKTMTQECIDRLNKAGMHISIQY